MYLECMYVCVNVCVCASVCLCVCTTFRYLHSVRCVFAVISLAYLKVSLSTVPNTNTNTKSEYESVTPVVDNY